MDGVTARHTPLFSTPLLRLLSPDDRGIARGLEMIAFPGTPVEILRAEGESAYVSLLGYPNAGYIEASAIDRGGSPRACCIPSLDAMVRQMVSRVGLPYVWGGNWVSPGFEGLDCSGLLYEASGGFTPRNTRELASFGTAIDDPSNVKALDILLYNEGVDGWEGHIIIAISESEVIESKHEYGGVVVSSVAERLAAIRHRPIWHRRWHPDALQKFS